MQTPGQLFLLLLTLVSSIHALAIPTSFESASHLFKRKGGGGGGGRGGGGSSSGSSSSSSSSSSGGSRGGVAGVGPQPTRYGGGAYYGGGSARPYGAGQRSPGGLAPVFLGVGAIAFLGAGAAGYYAYGAYGYRYDDDVTYYNETADEDQTRPVECFCARYSQCACEQQDDEDYVNSVANNATIAQVADVNGTSTLVINGTLPNGTVAAEEATEDPESSSNAAVSGKTLEMGGMALLSAAVAVGVSML